MKYTTLTTVGEQIQGGVSLAPEPVPVPVPVPGARGKGVAGR